MNHIDSHFARADRERPVAAPGCLPRRAPPLRIDRRIRPDRFFFAFPRSSWERQSVSPGGFPEPAHRQLTTAHQASNHGVSSQRHARVQQPGRAARAPDLPRSRQRHARRASTTRWRRRGSGPRGGGHAITADAPAFDRRLGRREDLASAAPTACRAQRRVSSRSRESRAGPRDRIDLQNAGGTSARSRRSRRSVPLQRCALRRCSRATARVTIATRLRRHVVTVRERQGAERLDAPSHAPSAPRGATWSRGGVKARRQLRSDVPDLPHSLSTAVNTDGSPTWWTATSASRARWRSGSRTRSTTSLETTLRPGPGTRMERTRGRQRAGGGLQLRRVVARARALRAGRRVRGAARARRRGLQRAGARRAHADGPDARARRSGVGGARALAPGRFA